MGFAKCHDKFDKSDEAIMSLEKSMAKADSQETKKEVAGELISIYRKLAEKYEVEAKEFDENVQAALNYYEKCLIVCNKAGKKDLQGQISHKIGKIYFNYQQFEKSIEHQTTYLTLAEELKDVIQLTKIIKKMKKNHFSKFFPSSENRLRTRWRLTRPLRSATWLLMTMIPRCITSRPTRS